jgi:hypothetical protein
MAIGYQSQEIKVGKDTIIDIQLDSKPIKRKRIKTKQ